MRTTKLLATLLVAALAIVACKQDEDYVLPSITLSTPTLDFSAATEQSIDLLATRDWQILGKPEWVQRIEPDHGPGTSTLQRIRLIADPNEGYNREDEIVFTIGLSKATLSISQPGAKGEIPVGTGTKDDPYTVKGVLRYIETLGADVESPQDVYIKGKISEITEPFSTQYGNASFKIKGDDGEVFTVYRALYLGNKKWTANDTQIKEGDEVVVCGKVINYKGNTPETQQNKAYVYSLNGETQGSGGGGETTEIKTVTVAQFIAAEPSKTQKYQLTGVVTGNLNTQYGNFDLKDDTGTVYVYGLTKTDNGYGTKNDQSFASIGVKAGDTVTIIGYRETYKKEGQEDKVEVVYAYYVSHTEGSGGNEQGGGAQQGGTIFSQAFKADGQGNFSIDNKSLPEGLEYVWNHDSKYGMKASAFKDTKCLASESWLISPEIDLSAATNPILTFSHALNKFESVDAMKNEATVWAKASGGEWTKLSGVAYSENSNWTFVDSGEIDLSAYAGKKMQIAFKYTSSESSAGTWEVDNFAVKEK